MDGTRLRASAFACRAAHGWDSQLCVLWPGVTNPLHLLWPGLTNPLCLLCPGDQPNRSTALWAHCICCPFLTSALLSPGPSLCCPSALPQSWRRRLRGERACPMQALYNLTLLRSSCPPTASGAGAGVCCAQLWWHPTQAFPPGVLSHACPTLPHLVAAFLPAPLLPQELAQAFAAGDLSHAAELTTQLRYVCRIKEAILDKM